MKHITKTAREEIAVKLRNELQDIQYGRLKNKRAIKELAQQQQILKAKAVELRNMIRSLGCPVEAPKERFG